MFSPGLSVEEKVIAPHDNMETAKLIEEEEVEVGRVSCLFII